MRLRTIDWWGGSTRGMCSEVIRYHTHQVWYIMIRQYTLPTLCINTHYPPFASIHITHYVNTHYPLYQYQYTLTITSIHTTHPLYQFTLTITSIHPNHSCPLHHPFNLPSPPSPPPNPPLVQPLSTHPLNLPLPSLLPLLHPWSTPTEKPESLVPYDDLPTPFTTPLHPPS